MLPLFRYLHRHLSSCNESSPLFNTYTLHASTKKSKTPVTIGSSAQFHGGFVKGFSE